LRLDLSPTERLRKLTIVLVEGASIFDDLN